MGAPGPYGAASMARTITPDLVEIALSVLWAAVAARLAEIDPRAPAPEPDRVLSALGMCIVRGQLDEVDGRIITPHDHRGAATA